MPGFIEFVLQPPLFKFNLWNIFFIGYFAFIPDDQTIFPAKIMFELMSRLAF